MPVISQKKAQELGIPHNTLQTILFNRNSWTFDDAVGWLIRHGKAHSYYRPTANEHRFMQTNPVRGARYFSKRLGDFAPEYDKLKDIVYVFQTY